jgi:sec-independent protein translocase protein TatB
MFDIGWTELLLIAVVALIVIGPKELPGALRTLGQWMGKVRRMAGEFQGQFREAMREAEFADLKKDVDDIAAKASGYADFDPIGDVRRDIEKSVGDLPALDTPLESAGKTALDTADASAGEASAVAQADAGAVAQADAGAEPAAAIAEAASAPPKAETAALPAEQEPPADTAAAPAAGRAPA